MRSDKRNDRFILLIVLIIIILLSYINAALADYWAGATKQEIFSKNKKYKFVIIPQSKKCIGELYERHDEKEYKLLWKTTLRNKARVGNEVSPVSAVVSNTGKYIVTFDDWHEMGYGDNVIVIYGEGGTLLYKYALADILTESEIKDSVPRSASSLWWRCKDFDSCYEDDTYIDEDEMLVIITSVGERVVVLKYGTVLGKPSNKEEGK